MTERIRPLVLGYIRENVLRGERLAGARARLERFAHNEGFTLGTVFVERRHTALGAFDALMDEIHRGDEAWAIVVPDVGHLDDRQLRAMSTRQVDYVSTTVLVAP
jgi:hypothetical protein